MEGNFEGGYPSQCVGERWTIWRGHAGIRNDDRVTIQFCAVSLQKWRQVFAANFFLTFDQECEIARQLGSGFEISFDRF